MKSGLKDDLFTIVKGYIIGSSMSVPGVSGGTMAILLGIYDRLISSISNFLKTSKAMCCFSKVLHWDRFGNLFPFISYKMAFGEISGARVHVFLGAVIGGIPALYKKTKESSLRISSAFYFLLGLLVVISIGFIPEESINIGSGSGVVHYLMILVAGIVIALAFGASGYQYFPYAAGTWHV